MALDFLDFKGDLVDFKPTLDESDFTLDDVKPTFDEIDSTPDRVGSSGAGLAKESTLTRFEDSPTSPVKGEGCLYTH